MLIMISCLVVVLQVHANYDIMFLKWAHQCRKISLRSPSLVWLPLSCLSYGDGALHYIIFGFENRVVKNMYVKDDIP